MPRGVIPAAKRHLNIILVTASHDAFQPLIKSVRIVSANALNPHFASVLADLLRLGNELGFLPALRAALYGIYIFGEIKSPGSHNTSAQPTERLFRVCSVVLVMRRLSVAD